ncbi:MAG: GNAT family N-acetyltransferase [Betaproteobacteria bacterium]
MNVLETGRLRLRWVATADAAFVVELLNDPSWIRFIGDKGVRTIEEASAYIIKGPIAMYAHHGFGLYVTELKDSDIPIGLCGLIKRDSLDDVDIGFAFLPAYRANGYAYESASAVMAYGRNVLGMKRIVAITSPDNDDSAKLLRRLGLRFERKVRLADDAREIDLYAPEA